MLKLHRFVLARSAAAVLIFLLAVSTAFAQIPAAPNCAVDQPPPDAGIYVTPGGFLLVHPRNAGLSDRYTGCKVLWVAAAPDRFILLATLYFEQGRLRVAHSYDKEGASRGTCTLPGQSPGCEGVESNPLSALRLPTWPRSCMDRPSDSHCAKEPD
jgi:hypothetical protein